MQYVRSLEQRCKQLEDEKRQLLSKISQVSPSDPILNNPGALNDEPPLSGRPEAVVRALQVLEVREQLEQGRQLEIRTTEEPSEQNQQDMDDGEKALVREMCNVSLLFIYFKLKFIH